MRVSLLNLNLVAKDAIGACIIAQARFFRERGDVVQIFVEQPPEGVPPDIAPLCRTVTLAQLRQDPAGLFAASDLLIYHYGSRHSLMETIAEVDGGLVIFYYHNVTPPELWNWEEDKPVLRRGVEGVKLAAHADLVLGDSRFNLEELARRVPLPPERLIPLPLPVDTSAFRPGPLAADLQRTYGLAGGPVLLYVGRMAPNKRIDLLVELLAAVRRHPTHPQPAARLLLVGDHDSAPAYRLHADLARKRAQALRVADGVIFAGRVDRLPDHYRLASVYVTTSQHEGFCVPLVEAMASGVPCVAAATSAVPETLGDAGILIDVDADGEVNIAAMADAVVQVLSDADHAADLRHRGLARSAEYTLPRYYERLAAILDRHCVNLPLRPLPAPHVQMAEAEPPAASVPPAASPEPPAEPPAQAPADGLFWPELAAEARVAMPEYVVRSKAPLVGPLIAWVRRNLTSHLKEPYLDLIVQRQQGFNLRSAWITDELTRRITQMSRQVQALEQAIAQAAQTYAGLQTLLAQTNAALQQTLAGQQAQIEQLRAAQEDARVRQLRAESHIARLEAGPTSPAQTDVALEPAPQAAYGFNYLRCNEAVGGSLEDEMALYADFVPLFRDQAAPILDLGCGRGAFLRLLQAAGIPAYGLDIDPDMVAACRAAGLQAEEGDLFEHLRGRPDESLGGIFCAHVVEHVPRTRLMELADLCWRKLRAGAAVVWITPHGGSLAPLHATFYKDLTHTRPLHPDLLAFVLEANGFRQVETRTLSDMPAEKKLQPVPAEAGDELAAILNRNIARLNDLIFGHVDCAVIGRRP